MNREIQKYLNIIEDTIRQNQVESWFRRISKQVEEENLSLTEQEHIVDYLNAKDMKLAKASLKQVLSNVKKWDKALQKKGNNMKETDDDVEVIKEWGNGFSFVKLKSKSSYEREGALMRHCVASYYGRDVEVYSLRDKNNKPHCTIEKDQQIKGKGNGSINPKYIKYVVEFLEEIGMDVRDSEMKNLGYVNVKEVKKELGIPKKLLFRDVYFYKDDFNKLSKEKIENIKYWNLFGLVDIVSHNVKFNFNIKLSIKNFNRTIKDKINNNDKIANSPYSTAVANRHSSTAVANRHSSTAVANRYDSTAVANSSYSTAVANDKNSVAIISNTKLNHQSKVKGKKGSVIVIVERDDNENIINVFSSIVGENGIKENVFYTLQNGKVVEV